MKRTFSKILAATAVAAVLGILFPVHAASGLYPLPAESMAKYGATHEYIVTHADLTTTASNTAQTITFDVDANTGIALVGFILDEAFDDGTTDTTNSLTVIVGDGTDNDFFLTSTQIAGDGSEVFYKFAPIGTVTITATSATPVSVSALGFKAYTADDTIDHVFTPDAITPLDQYNSGKLRILYKTLP